MRASIRLSADLHRACSLLHTTGCFEAVGAAPSALATARLGNHRCTAATAWSITSSGSGTCCEKQPRCGSARHLPHGSYTATAAVTPPEERDPSSQPAAPSSYRACATESAAALQSVRSVSAIQHLSGPLPAAERPDERIRQDRLRQDQRLHIRQDIQHTASPSTARPPLACAERPTAAEPALWLPRPGSYSSPSLPYYSTGGGRLQLRWASNLGSNPPGGADARPASESNSGVRLSRPTLPLELAARQSLSLA